MAKYRPNVAVIVQREDGRILVAERMDVKNAWQFPQGGVDTGEDLIAAMKRELVEETGIGEDLVELQQCRTGYRYKFPNGHLKKGVWVGQEQTYFLVAYSGTDADIDLTQHDQEFSDYAWIRPEEFQLRWVPGFKRKVYSRVLRDFFGVEFKD